MIAERPGRWRPGHLLLLGLVLATLLSLLHVFDRMSEPLLDPLDTGAEAVAAGIGERAAQAFLVSKGINAALSFAERVTVTGDVFILEGSVQPAAALTPINNLVDQFARIMLVVAASALLIEFLLHIGAGYGTSVLLALPLALFALGLLSQGRSYAPAIRRVACFTAVVAVLVRLALPLALVVTGAVADHYLAERYREANAGLEVLRVRTDAAADAAAVAEDKTWTASVVEAVQATFAMVRETFDDTFKDVVTMVTVFFLETVLLPLLIVLALWRSLGLLMARAERRR